MPHRLYPVESTSQSHNGLCDDVAQALARVLPGSGSVAIAWSDQVSDIYGARYYGNPRLLEDAQHALENGESDEAGCYLWWSSDEQTQYALVWETNRPISATWLKSWQKLASHLVETTLERTYLQEHVYALEHLQSMQQVLYEIAELASNETDLPRLFKHVHQLISALMPTDFFCVLEYKAATEHVRFLYFDDAHNANDEESSPKLMSLYALKDSKYPLLRAFLRQSHPLFGSPHELLQRLHLQRSELGNNCIHWLGVPMMREGHVVGAIIARSYKANAYFSDQNMTLLSFVAQHVQTATERRLVKLQLETRVRERTYDLERANIALKERITAHERAERLQRALFRISELANGSDDLTKFCAQIHAVLDELLDASNFHIALVDPQNASLDFVYFVDEHNPQPLTDIGPEGLTAYLINKRVPLLLSRNAILALREENKVKVSGVQAQSWLGVPMFSDEEIIGAIVVQSYVPGISYTLHDQQLMAFAAHNIGTGLSRQRAQQRLRGMYAELETRVQERTHELAEVNDRLRAQIAERMRAEERLRYQASHDALTGLPNRAHLLQSLADSITLAHTNTVAEHDRLFAVLFLDLDRFKLVNDSVGHAAGDRMLIEAAKRIVASVRENDLVARLGGDEFAVLLRGLDGLPLVLHVVERLLEMLGQPMWVAGRELFPSSSVGVAMWNATYDDGEEILRDADAAMYRAKSQRQARYAVFDDEMRQEATRTLDLETDLRRAIKQKDFCPFYQPIVRLSNNQVVGFEALLRWKHSSQGYLQPDAFLQLEQISGLIELVDWQIYEQVIDTLAHNCDKNFYISVNVSPQHFYSTDFATRLLSLLDTYKANPKRLRLEITEVALLHDEPKILETLNMLRERGILIQLDDFGTGYSALSYLHRFPISGLKIDQSFVAGLQQEGDGSYPLVRSIIALATTLGIDTIAEGVQTQHQRTLLENLGCLYAQGYLLGVPAPLLSFP